MKRKDLKAGEWYRWDEQPERICLALPEQAFRMEPQVFLDISCDGPGQQIEMWVSNTEPITHCDPPTWFGEVWVKRDSVSPDASIGPQIHGSLENMNGALHDIVQILMNRL